jgi:hypothetical protein
MATAKRLAGLKSALETASGGRVRPNLAPVEQVPSPAVPAEKGASRSGKVHVGAWLSPAYKTSLRMIQVKSDKDFQKLISEALNDLFAKYDVPTVGD